MDLVLLLFFFSILVFLGLRFISFKAGFKVHQTIKTLFLSIHICLIVLFASTIILADKGIYYWGYRSTSWIFLAMTFSGVIYFLLSPDSRILGTWIVFPFMITIICVGLSSLLVYMLISDYKSDLVYKDDKYRLERTGWFITPCKLPSLFIKKGLFEKKAVYVNEHCLFKGEIDSIKIKKTSGDTIRVTFYHHSDWESIPKPLEAIAINR